ncbi:MAG: iron-containing alcohol dehydrogenase [Deinococcus sp.]|nr:iron-containing alcohol dehydrogenase [Deinococcus sp.]
MALGGGSAIDVAKAIGLLLTNGGTIADYQWRERPISSPLPPLIAIPTTAGTGSEVSHVTVILDVQRRTKKGIVSPRLFPVLAILDPALTVSLPPRLTAATAFDALGHAIEAFAGKGAQAWTDLLALGAMACIRRALPQAVQQGHDLQARGDLLLASLWAGIAMDQAGLGIVHALAGPLCSHYRLHHGLAIAILLPFGLEYNLEAIGSHLPQLAEALGCPRSAVVPELRRFLVSTGLPTSLSQAGVPEIDLELCAQEAASLPLGRNNPRPVTVAACRQLFQAAL